MTMQATAFSAPNTQLNLSDYVGGVRADLGSLEVRTDIRSSIGPFYTLPGYQTTYPAVVVQALAELYAEYNLAFCELVKANREWDTDYQFMFCSSGNPINFGVQIDMTGLPQGFLDAASDMSVDEVREVLRRGIFEIENSLAMYQLIERICAPAAEESFFKQRFRASLEQLRTRFDKPIALLAVTEQKHAAMLESEFGKQPGESLSDEEVRALSGFDCLFGPEEFRAHVAENSGKCDYLLYVRSSDPVDKLKKPNIEVDHPLLGDDEMRCVIKANAVTFNVDDPTMSPARRINDTKGYMAPMGMAFEIEATTDLYSVEFVAHLDAHGLYQEFEGARLSPEFAAYLVCNGVDPKQIETGEVHLRAKPIQGTYGCYGHVTGSLTDGKRFRGELRRQMRKRGAYVIQPEMQIPSIVNTTDGAEFQYIDRNFFAFTNGHPVFLGGFRSMMPVDSAEAKKGRIHGNCSTVWAEILA